MQATEMNHLLNVLTPALGEEAGSGSAMSVEKKQEVNSGSTWLCLSPACSYAGPAVMQKMKHNRKYLNTFGEDGLLPFLSHFSAPIRYKL